MRRDLKVLVVGSGGREHALSAALARSASVAEVLVCPGNGGTAGCARNLPPLASAALVERASAEKIDFAVVGPEAPLVDGLADRLRASGIPTFGPGAAAAKLEGSKAFMKQLALDEGVPTSSFAVFTDVALAIRHIESLAEPPVIKADGLCAGKGVVVAQSTEEAVAAARAMLSGEAFGAAGQTIVVEERVRGIEASVHAICDGERYFVLPAVQDHKRIFDGDQGPNTGGMGVFGPTPVVTPELEAAVAKQAIEPVLRGLARRGTPFHGALFAGIMITPEGRPMVLEYNVRFGDPETEVLTELIDGDLGGALYAAACGRLEPSMLSRKRADAVAVVLASEGYPGTPVTGDRISGVEDAAALPDVRVFHAATRREGAALVTTGGRVLVVTATGDTLRAARDRAYEGVSKIHFRGMQFRRDIGARALERQGLV